MHAVVQGPCRALLPLTAFVALLPSCAMQALQTRTLPHMGAWGSLGPPGVGPTWPYHEVPGTQPLISIHGLIMIGVLA